MKKIIFVLMAMAITLPMMAQQKNTKAAKPTTKPKTEQKQAAKPDEAPLPKVYDEGINAMDQIEMALEEARNTGRKVICQVGGNWCPWCLRFANFITKDDEIATIVEKNYVYIHVNTSKENKNTEALRRLGNPGRFGYPVLVILDRQGQVMHIQNSSYLELDKSYDRKKVLEFFLNWTDEAIEKIK